MQYLNLGNLSRLLRELDTCYHAIGELIASTTGFAGAEAIARLGDEHFLSLTAGQHEIYSRQISDAEEAWKPFELALDVYHRADIIKKQIVKNMLPKIHQLANFCIKQYFFDIPNADIEEIRSDLILIGSEAILREIGTIKYGEYNIHHDFKHLCKAVLTAMEKYSAEFAPLLKKKVG